MVENPLSPSIEAQDMLEKAKTQFYPDSRRPKEEITHEIRRENPTDFQKTLYKQNKIRQVKKKTEMQ